VSDHVTGDTVAEHRLVAPGGEDVTELHGQGWSDRIIAEIVGLVTLNLMTGAFNLVAGLEPASSTADMVTPATTTT
jgi:hypothetical protein